MFSGLFGKKSTTIPVKDTVWLNSAGRWQACSDWLLAHPGSAILAWFPADLREAKARLGGDPQTFLGMAEQAGSRFWTEPPVFLGHYPLQKKEQEVFASLGLKEAIVFNALDDAFFLGFGGEKIAGLMKKLGMAENEPISHAMISSSIAKAQEKLEKKVLADHSADSLEEWMRGLI